MENNIILYTDENGETDISVRFAEEDVRVTQKQLAEVYQTTWITQDKKTLKKINQLLSDIERNGYEGLGYPEPLKGSFSGYWSGTIDEKNRLIYKIEDGLIKIIQCRNHYNDK